MNEIYYLHEAINTFFAIPDIALLFNGVVFAILAIIVGIVIYLLTEVVNKNDQ